jgi:ketosteroid isomerase-like protein
MFENLTLPTTSFREADMDRRMLALGALAVLACGKPAAVHRAADELVLRQLDGKFGAFAARKDSAGAAALYAPDAVIMAPDAPAVRGETAIRALWSALVVTPGLVLRVVPERIDVAPDGDFATDMGTVTMERDGPSGRETEVAKYLEVWRKQGGSWRVVYDMWNSNAPAPK